MTNLYSSIAFFGLVAAVVPIFRLLAIKFSERGRTVILVILSIAILALLKNSAHWLAVTAIYSALLSGAAKLLYRFRDNTKTSLAMAVAIAIVVFVLFSLKYEYYFQLLFGSHAWQTDLTNVQWVGISYLTFRAIDLLVYSRSSRAKAFSFFHALAYLLFFAPFSAGPINRFHSFLEDESVGLKKMTEHELRRILLRTASGVVKVSLIAPALKSYSVYSPTGIALSKISPLALLLSLYATLLFIYMDFSGYCDVAISVGRLFGVRLPENFKFPFVSANLQDFWNRWHISFTEFCRTYIFFILLRQFKLRLAWMPNMLAQALCIAVTFFFMGAWHGSALNWIYYGMYHATGMVAWLVFSQTLSHNLPEFYRKLKGAVTYRIFSICVTITFVSVGLILTVDSGVAKNLLPPCAARFFSFMIAARGSP